MGFVQRSSGGKAEGDGRDWNDVNAWADNIGKDIAKPAL